MAEYILYTDEDKNAPESIKDRNGQVVLSMCKVCGKAEIELSEPCVDPVEKMEQLKGQTDKYIKQATELLSLV